MLALREVVHVGRDDLTGGEGRPEQLLGRIDRRPGRDREGVSPVQVGQTGAVKGDPSIVNRELELPGSLVQVDGTLSCLRMLTMSSVPDTAGEAPRRTSELPS